LRRIGWTILWSVTAVFLAASILGAYASHRYQAALAKAQAAGLPNTWDELLPKPVADGDNFGALEDFKPFVAVEEVACTPSPVNPYGTKLQYLDEKGMDALKSIKPLKVTGGSLQSLGFFTARSLADLRSKAVAENRLSAESANLSDADAILKVFEDLDPLWSRMHAVKQRPHAVLSTGFKPSLTTASPMVGVSLSLAHIAQLNARALISANRGAESLEECLLLLKIADLRAFPTLIEHLVRLSEIGVLMPALHEGISQHVWSDAQLDVIGQKLARYDLLVELKQNLGAEVLVSKDMTGVMQSNRAVAQTLVQMLPRLGFSREEKFVPAAMLKTFMNILGSGSVEAAVHMAGCLSEKDGQNLRAHTMQLDLNWGPFNSLAGVGVPALESVFKTTVRGQSLVNIARVAIALERHRLQHGSFPTALEQLAPDFLPLIPTEVFDGAPLHYAPKSNGQGFTLYSTGWKGTDDGGAADYSKPNETNWVWNSP
jgi:hypothetical protein